MCASGDKKPKNRMPDWPLPMSPEDLRQRINETLVHVHEHTSAYHDPSSAHALLKPVDPSTVGAPRNAEILRQQKDYFTKMYETEYNFFESDSHGATHVLPERDAVVFEKNFWPKTDELKYLYARFGDLVTHLLAKHLRALKLNVQIQVVRFVPNKTYVLPMLTHQGRSIRLMDAHTQLMRETERCYTYVKHNVIVCEGVAIDMLSHVFSNAGYDGVEYWDFDDANPYKSNGHEHSDGTGRYVLWDGDENFHHLFSLTTSIGAFLNFSSLLGVYYKPEVADGLLPIWDLDEPTSRRY